VLAVVEDPESILVVVTAVDVLVEFGVGCCVFSGSYPMNGSLNVVVYGDMLDIRALRIWDRRAGVDEEHVKRWQNLSSIRADCQAWI